MLSLRPVTKVRSLLIVAILFVGAVAPSLSSGIAGAHPQEAFHGSCNRSYTVVVDSSDRRNVWQSWATAGSCYRVCGLHP